MKRLSLLMLLSFVLVACGAQSTEIQPPKIAYGQDVCDACGMIIDDAHFAAAILLTNGETRKFDDVGEMFAYYAKHADLEIRAWFVHDYLSEDWTRGETAFYVTNLQIMSPMDKGIVAFAKRSDADDYAVKHKGQAVTFDELRAQSVTDKTMHVNKSH